MALKFAVVDIETTGLYHQDHDITEVAVVHVDDGGLRQVFHSLINPNRQIPSQISGLTGINNSLVEGAPSFEDVLGELERVLEGRIFVAHNVNFDYQFLKAAFEKRGLKLVAKRFCTMRYARKLFPNLPNHRLGTVINHLDISNESVHRAHGDAMALALAFEKMKSMDRDGVLEELLKGNNRTTILPPKVPREMVEAIPETTGVYYFYDESERMIYVGKAKNLRKRVLSHFTSSGATRKKQMFQKDVARIGFQETINEYEAFLVEDAEIKRRWPKYNRAQKSRGESFAVVPYINRAGKTRFAVTKSNFRSDALGWFVSVQRAKEWLKMALIEWGIDLSRGGFYTDFQMDLDSRSEEESIELFIHHQYNEMKRSYVLGTQSDEGLFHFAAVVNGRYWGYGKLENESDINQDLIEKVTIKAPDSPMVRAILERMIQDEQIREYEI